MQLVTSNYISGTLKMFTPIFVIVLLLVGCSTDSSEIDNNKEERCCETDNRSANSITSEITCPECGHKATEPLPTEVCLIKYECKECGKLMTPQNNDCCVFCTYGTHKCPSMQND